MLKPGPNYRMSSQTKRTLALTKFASEEQRNAWKRAMIDAELSAALAPKKEKKPRHGGNFAQTDSETN